MPKVKRTKKTASKKATAAKSAPPAPVAPVEKAAVALEEIKASAPAASNPFESITALFNKN